MQDNDVIEYFERTAEQFLSKDEFRARLRSGKQLRIKYGVDVKTSTLHIGHAVNLWLIRRLQDMGHKVVFVFADFTSRVGTTDGRLETISGMPAKEVQKNIDELLTQAKMILRFDDPKLIEIHRNSEWYKKMSVQDIMDLFSTVTHAKLIAGDTFQMRIAQEKEIYINELLYPILQGYDSYKMQSDVTIVGSDQLFNESIGRLLQEKHKMKPQTVITTVMTPGIDGRNKQSQRRDNDISLFHSSRDKFGRVMSIPDTVINDYLRIYTDMPLPKIQEMESMIRDNPRDAKMVLATEIVARYHGRQVAEEEREWFDNTISKGYIPEDLPKLIVTTHHMDALDLVCLARPQKSRSDSRRLIEQGGVELNGRKLRRAQQEIYLKDNDTLQVGKREWFRIEVVELPSFETQRLSVRPMGIRDIAHISRVLSKVDIGKYIIRFGNAKKNAASALEEAFRKLILSSDRDAGLWIVTSKVDKNAALGLAYLRADGKDHNIWLAPQVDDGVVGEIMPELSEYMLTLLDPKGEMFKQAFAMATTQKEIEMLPNAYRMLNSDLLSKNDGLGITGISKGGWDRLQAWRRMTSPWLFKNEPQPSAPQQNIQQKTVQQSPQAPAPPTTKNPL